MRNRQKLKAAEGIKKDIKDIKEIKDIFEIERRKFFELDEKAATR